MPDTWVVIEFDSEYGKIQKVFAGWYGGYGGSDSWKLSSGIVKVVKHETYIDFHNDSGSIYKCHIGCQKMSGYQHSILQNWVKQLESTNAKLDIIHYELPQN